MVVFARLSPLASQITLEADRADEMELIGIAFSKGNPVQVECGGFQERCSLTTIQPLFIMLWQVQSSLEKIIPTDHVVAAMDEDVLSKNKFSYDPCQRLADRSFNHSRPSKANSSWTSMGEKRRLPHVATYRWLKEKL